MFSPIVLEATARWYRHRPVSKLGFTGLNYIRYRSCRKVILFWHVCQILSFAASPCWMQGIIPAAGHFASAAKGSLAHIPLRDPRGGTSLLLFVFFLWEDNLLRSASSTFWHGVMPWALRKALWRSNLQSAFLAWKRSMTFARFNVRFWTHRTKGITHAGWSWWRNVSIRC